MHLQESNTGPLSSESITQDPKKKKKLMENEERAHFKAEH
jgi:hypothetical protein